MGCCCCWNGGGGVGGGIGGGAGYGGGPPHYGYGGRRLAAVPAAAAEARQRPCTSTVHEDSLSPTFHACCSFGGVSSSGAQVRVQILDHDETLLSLAPDPVIGDARASLSADVSTQQVALTIRGSPLPGQAAGTVKLNSWFIADDPKDASLQAVAVVAAMPGGNSMQGVRATITPDFRSPEASAAGFVAHAGSDTRGHSDHRSEPGRRTRDARTDTRGSPWTRTSA